MKREVTLIQSLLISDVLQGCLHYAFLFLWHLGKDSLIYMFERAHMLQQKDNVDLSLFSVLLSLSHS